MVSFQSHVQFAHYHMRYNPASGGVFEKALNALLNVRDISRRLMSKRQSPICVHTSSRSRFGNVLVTLHA